MATWPVTLPQTPLAEGYHSTPQDNVLRSEMDAGPEKARRRFTAKSEYITCQWDLSGAELIIFENFFEDDILDGSIEFDFPHPQDGGTVSAMIRAPYEKEPMAHRWRVHTEIEILPETAEITT